jgi:hypothetical protein
MRTRLRPIIRDYSYARSRRYLRVQCEPLGMKFIARFYTDDFPTIADARLAAGKLCDALEPALKAAYADHKHDPRKYFGKKSTPKSSNLPAGLSYEPTGFPHHHIVVRWQASGKSRLKRFRLRHGRYPAIIRAAVRLRAVKIREEETRVDQLQARVARKLRQAFGAAKKTGAHIIMHD